MRFTKMLTTVHAPRGRASRTSLMWPSCRLPMVGTSTLFGSRASRARSSATEWMTCIGRRSAGSAFNGERLDGVAMPELSLEHRVFQLHLEAGRGADAALRRERAAEHGLACLQAAEARHEVFRGAHRRNFA